MKLGWRIWVLIVFILLAILAIHPTFEKGVVVLSVERNSTAFNQGLRSGDIIKEINGQTITDKDDYLNVINSIYSVNGSKKIDIQTTKEDLVLFSDKSLNITVGNIPHTAIKTGLDLSGGARALVQPEGNISDKQFDDLIDISRNRFNVFGLSDVQITKQIGFGGEKYMLVQVAGATPTDLQDLISQQGKFEAKIGNQTVFQGGKADISDVCRSGTCSGIQSCAASQSGGYNCQFMFTVYLTQEAANRHANITKSIPTDSTGQYLANKLDLYVDNNLVDSLLISVNLKGQTTTQISIQGPGTGTTQTEAFNDATANMKKLQTILITGSLPYKLNIVKLDTISPNLGQQFTYLIVLAAIASLVAVSIIILVRYRKIKVSLALLATSFSEIIIILGVAAFIRWNLDLPSIAGILATIGTGLDSQIVILDEARRGVQTSLKEKIKNALFIILAAYATAAASLLPLGWAGAGLLKGFAITTFIGISAGVLISRPAFAEMIKKIETH